MAPTDEIRNFITHQTNYSYGVTLLSKVHKNKRLVYSLFKKESNKNWEKLIYEMKKYLKNDVKHQNVNAEYQDESIIPIIVKPNESYSIPKIHNQHIESGKKEEFQTSTFLNSPITQSTSNLNLLASVKQKRMLLYRSRGHFHGRLHEARTNEIRKQLAGDIISIQNDIESVNKDLSLIEAGKIPKELVLKMMDAEQYKDYRNAQNYVVRYRNYLKKEDLSEEKRQSYQAKLEQYQTKIENFFSNV